MKKGKKMKDKLERKEKAMKKEEKNQSSLERKKKKKLMKKTERQSRLERKKTRSNKKNIKRKIERETEKKKKTFSILASTKNIGIFLFCIFHCFFIAFLQWSDRFLFMFRCFYPESSPLVTYEL